MFKVSDISTEYISPYLKLRGSVMRTDDEGNWYELELENISIARVWGIKVQLKFYNKLGEFIGFEEDTHESYLEPSRKTALSIYAKPPADYDQASLTIDATVEEKEGEGIKDYLVAIGLLVLMVGGVTAYRLFK